jgi:hypothetical protein
MAEPINLDELLSSEEKIDATQETSDDSNEPIDTNDGVEGEGDDDSSEDSGTQNDEPDEENTEGDDVAGSDEGDDDNADDDSVPLEQTEQDTTKSDPVEYNFKDDFIRKAVEYYEMYGTLQPYLEATSVDYDSMDDVEVLRLHFNKENSDLSEKARTRLFEKQLEKYNLDAYDEDDIEVGNALLKRDASKLRNSLKEEQSQFIQSVQAPKAQEPTVSQAELEAEAAKSRKIIEQGVSGVVKNNLIKLDANGEGINYQFAETSKVVDYALDSSKFLSTFAKDGSVDWDKWTKVVAFAENPTQFISELIKHGKSLGRKSMEAELKNATPTMTSKEVISTGEIEKPSDDPIGFLRGMVVNKR